MIEVECGGSVFVLKDNSMRNSELNNANLPASMEIFRMPIDASVLNGFYVGMNNGQATLILSLYSSPEDSETVIGNAEVYDGEGQCAYLGDVTAVAENVYKIATDTGDEVLLNALMDGNSVKLQLYVNGSLSEEYQRMENEEPYGKGLSSKMCKFLNFSYTCSLLQGVSELLCKFFQNPHKSGVL